MFNLWLNLRCAGLKAGVGKLARLPQFEPLVSVSADAQNVDHLRRCGAYPLIVQHHVQALVVGNRGESGGDNRLLFGTLVLEAAALHLKDAGAPPGSGHRVGSLPPAGSVLPAGPQRFQYVPVLTRSLLSAARLPRLASPSACIRHPLV